MAGKRSRVRVGFIGAGGFISAHHLLTARDSDIMEIRAIADIDEKRLAEHAANTPIGYTTTDYRELLADFGLDIVVIGTKQDLHARLVVEALDAGKWALCEKPMTETAEETKAVLAAEARNPGRLAVGFNRRFAPAYADTKRLLQGIPRPWYINYRLMAPNPDKHEGFYAMQPRMLYEGCHILDLACWLLDDQPKRVFMTGDPRLNNCCILDYPDGSQLSFMCGSMGSVCFWKEYMEVFGRWAAITVSDFVDMRVRGLPGEYDRLYAPYMEEHAGEVDRYGFDFYETYKVHAFEQTYADYVRSHGMALVPVRRPIEAPFNVADHRQENPDLWSFTPDKGWIPAVEHFAQCFLDGTMPGNADGKAGALATDLALALLESLETGQAVDTGK